MTTTCDRGVEADVIARATRGELSADELATMREHVASCAACAATSRALERVKLAWSEAVAESPFAMRARDMSAVRRFSVVAARRRRSAFGAGLVVGLAVAAAATGVVVRRDREVTTASPAASFAPLVVASSVSATPAQVDPFGSPSSSDPSGRAARPDGPRGPVVTKTCASCKAVGGALTAGVVLGVSERVEVPPGAQLRLGFSLQEALEGPDSGFVVEGPAEVVSAANGVSLDRGRATVTTTSRAVVRTPHVVATSASSRWSLESGPRGARVDVIAGEVSLLSDSGVPLVTVSAGRHATVRDDGHVEGRDVPAALETARPSTSVAAPPPLTGAKTPAPSSASALVVVASTVRWSNAHRALERGDRSSAESELRALLAEAEAADPLSRRASFLLAELELARGDARAAQRRLLSLLGGPDAQLAEDAATLLARSYPAPADRARVWASYVAAQPASPRRERALLEEARALAAAGERDRARNIAERLCESASPEDVCRASRDLLRRL